MSRRLRVIAGQAGSVPLKVPQGGDVRPTTDAMRETLFASLGPDVRGGRFADLYAGSGAVGIEALSRGAAWAVFIEISRSCVEVIRANLENTGLDDRGIVVRRRLPQAWGEIAASHGLFDMVFVGAPYECPDLVKLAQRLVTQREGVAAPGIAIFQHNRSEPLLPYIAPDKVKQFGQSRIDIYYLDAD